MLRLSPIVAGLVLAGCSPQGPTPSAVDISGDFADLPFSVPGAEPHHWSEGADGLILFDRQERALQVMSISCPAPGQFFVRAPALQRSGLEAGKAGEQVELLADDARLSGPASWVSIHGDAAYPEATLDPAPDDLRRIRKSKSLAVRLNNRVHTWNGPSEALWARFDARCRAAQR